MTDEASKTRAVRGPQFESTYLRGSVIDIGCGPDPVVAHAEPFDLQHGDAQEIAALRPNGAYDAVHSSHCLEHMRDVPKALAQWWALVRKGGYLILVVPDEDLYEQGGWPSAFNYDHKATFQFGKEHSWSPVSYDILMLVSSLAGAVVISCDRQDLGYDYTLMRTPLSTADRAIFRLRRMTRAAIRRLGGPGRPLLGIANCFFRILNAPVDQTEGAALAQIQVIAQKRS
ncbi:MAG: class I SAM-dependent methyltransferase [Steroidobacteraceae bacterium]|jgi:SAM-dependent methyltransferase